MSVMPPLFELGATGGHDSAVRWKGAVQSTFPGLSVHSGAEAPAIGTIRNIALGGGQGFLIDSGPIEVSYHPEATPPKLGGSISLMLQRWGSARVFQGDNSSLAREGDLCLVDECRAFTLSSEGCSGIIFVRLPRATVLGRYPMLHSLFGRALSIHDEGTRFLATVLRSLPEFAGENEAKCNAVLNSLVSMLGVAGPVAGVCEPRHWRVRQALEFIDRNLSVAGIRADDVAEDQGISRRQLDLLMRRDVGDTIAGRLWALRLEEAAEALRAGDQAARSIAEICFQSGFEDPGHFSRAFKRRYGMTPSDWRRTGLAKANAREIGPAGDSRAPGSSRFRKFSFPDPASQSTETVIPARVHPLYRDR